MSMSVYKIFLWQRLSWAALVGTKICCWQSLHDELNQNIQRPIFCIISVYSNFSKIRNGNETELVQIWKSLSTSSNHNFREFLAQEEVGGFLGNVEETKLVSKLLENLILQPSGEKKTSINTSKNIKEIECNFVHILVMYLNLFFMPLPPQNMCSRIASIFIFYWQHPYFHLSCQF